MRKNIFVRIAVLAVAGAISGFLLIISLFTSDSDTGLLGQFNVWLGPGLWFGLVTAWLLLGRFKFGPATAVLWVGASMGAWHAAFQVLLRVGGDHFPGVGQMVLAGLAGSALLGVARLLLVRESGAIRLALVVVAGGVLALGMQQILTSYTQEDQGRIYALIFAIWQVGVGLALVLEGMPKKLNK